MAMNTINKAVQQNNSALTEVILLYYKSTQFTYAQNAN